MTPQYFLVAALLAAVIGILIFWLARRQQKSSGLPTGKVIYADTSKWGRVQKPLHDFKDWVLTGRPDYLVEQDGMIIPVEVKKLERTLGSL